MNRTVGDDWDYTIEVCIGRPNLLEEIREELRRREAIEKKTYSGNHRPLMAESPEKLGENRKMHRVRIRSPTVLSHLERLTRKLGNGSILNEEDNLVFMYPFYILGVYLDDMREILADMERGVLASSSIHPSEPEPKGQSPSVSPSPLDQMKCFVQFVEKSILPIHTALRQLDAQTTRRLSYAEISLLLEPGELIYVAPSLMTTKMLDRSAVQTVFRCLTRIPADHPINFDDGGWLTSEIGRLLADVYCLDHDGEEYTVCWRRLEMDYFDGEKDITALPFYPLKFHPNYERFLSNRAQQGTAFRALVADENLHHYYAGWTLITGLFERTESDGKPTETKPEDSEYVDSEVFLDTQEARRHMDDWPSLREPATVKGSLAVNDGADFCLWPMNAKKTLTQKPSRVLTREDLVYWRAREQYLLDNKWMIDDRVFIKEDWTNEDLALLPRRVYGYSLRDRKFLRLDVEKFRPHTLKTKANLDKIEIKDSHRMIIRAAVKSHFDRAAQVLNQDEATHFPDIFEGKGRGLVILLHGAPGVGKTATAEAVALEFDKPLFQITCGDLGTRPAEVETSLKAIFRYANMWSCILLLDEADVFLTQRNRTDVERNALVSEYYSGVLFLTTNRVGALDEAFRSRVHLSLFYPHLNRTDTAKILESNLQRLPRDDKLSPGITAGPNHVTVMDSEIREFVLQQFDEHYKLHERGPWNGRQIRNAVHIAMCLAFFENGRKGRRAPAILTAEHFRKVHETITEFEEYLRAARTVDDETLAQMEGLRYDKEGQAYKRQLVGSTKFHRWSENERQVTHQRQSVREQGQSYRETTSYTPSRRSFLGGDINPPTESRFSGSGPASRPNTQRYPPREIDDSHQTQDRYDMSDSGYGETGLRGTPRNYNLPPDRPRTPNCDYVVDGSPESVRSRSSGSGHSRVLGSSSYSRPSLEKTIIINS
ncbi:uncharacterized protein BDW70DRAFT_169440 [Aspergillus foveolatus]|uniref:uncharacterized protein n=1 Tax=Aspergillus foveolatus TaxID=210207 RepID=UPI003CCE2B7A